MSQNETQAIEYVQPVILLTTQPHVPDYCPLFMLETANHMIHSNTRAEEEEPKSQPCLSDIVSLK